MQMTITARVVRQVTRRVRIYSKEEVQRFRKQFGKRLGKFSAFRQTTGWDVFTARVPVVVTTVPETPGVITIRKDTYVRVCEKPLTYKQAITRKAVIDK